MIELSGVHRNSNNNGLRTCSTNERVAAGRLDTAGLRTERGQLTLSVVQRHVRDLHVAVVAADGPCYAAAAFSGRTVVEIPSSMSSETVNQIGGNGDTTIRRWFRGLSVKSSSFHTRSPRFCRTDRDSGDYVDVIDKELLGSVVKFRARHVLSYVCRKQISSTVVHFFHLRRNRLQ